MKKVINGIKSFFELIWKVIDKFIINPITKFILFIDSKINNQKKGLENWISKKTTLLFISLVFAIAIFIIVDQKILFYSESSAEVLSGQPVTADYNSEAYFIEGLPETVDIMLIGNKADLYIAKQSVIGNVTVDLKRYAGTLDGVTQEVAIEYNQGLSAVEYRVNPSTATVTIYKKDSISTTMTPEILNADHLNETISIEGINIDDDNVIVKGARKYIKEVAVVKALVDIDKLSSQTLDKQVLDNVALKAYDKDGNVVDVEIIPATASVEVELSESKKLVPVQVIPSGTVAFGLAIDTIELDTKEVWIYGSANDIKDITSIPVTVDVNQLANNKEYKLELPKPVGVKTMSINNVTVNVSVDTVTTRDIENVIVNGINAKEGLNPTASKDNGTITVTVKGVKNVIDNITKDDIMVYVDLSNLGAGTHDVPVNIEQSDVRVEYVPKKATVSIELVAK
ncbi:MAG: CdaR family protein [Clostridium sp.]|nr:CdaR family protein [Clostridium sp.]MCM1443690.1 CdaR family protein [Candidatus Amulumruptor caecigallinarius]